MRRAAGVVDAVEQLEGEGMVVHRAIPNQLFRMLDPFLLLDHMGPRDFGPGEGRGAPDHPHRGFETVTYVLEGKLQHKDSQGNVGELGPGDVQWMTAGAGVVHSEMPHPELQERGGRMHALQLWVNLPARDKMVPPVYQDIRAQDVPEVPVEGGSVRLVAGRFAEAEAAVATRTPISYLHARFEGELTLPVPAGHHAFVYVVDGAGEVGGKQVAGKQLVRLDEEGAEVLLTGRLDAILVSGQPLHEPVFQWGPFVMTSREEIAQALRDYQEGRMGSIPATFA